MFKYTLRSLYLGSETSRRITSVPLKSSSGVHDNLSKTPNSLSYEINALTSFFIRNAVCLISAFRCLDASVPLGDDRTVLKF